jgi:hypothetical protein
VHAEVYTSPYKGSWVPKKQPTQPNTAVLTQKHDALLNHGGRGRESNPHVLSDNDSVRSRQAPETEAVQEGALQFNRCHVSVFKAASPILIWHRTDNCSTA